jgi:hypothetical protein
MNLSQAIPHKSLRHTVFHRPGLLWGIAAAVLFDLGVLLAGEHLLAVHSHVTGRFLHLAGIPWDYGRVATILPGVETELIRTAFGTFGSSYPWLCLSITAALFLGVQRRIPAPVRPLLFVAPLSLGISVLYSRFVSAAGPPLCKPPRKRLAERS